MRVAIVNDMRMALEILRRIVNQSPNHVVAWTALDGQEAVEKCTQDRPDLILMDLIMPVMDGVEATRQIMANSPCAILVVTASVGANADKVYEAMSYGALDATNTPVLNQPTSSSGVDSLLGKMDDIEKLLQPSSLKPHQSPRASARSSEDSLSLLALGASTGGPQALGAILSGLPKDFPAAVVIIQHIDSQFAPGLADWLDTQCPLSVGLARENEKPEPGTARIAARNDHLVLAPDHTFQYTPEPRDLAYRPSVDAFFHSIVGCSPKSVTAALLTGMGDDGAEGLLALRQAGHHTIAQDQESCIVYGMPRAAAERNAAGEIVPLDRIAASIRIHYSLI